MQFSTVVAASVVFTAIIAAYLYTLITSDSLTQTGNTYAGHLACTILFGTSRSLQSAKDAEFIFPPVKFGRVFQVDRQKKCVTTSLSLRPDLSIVYCWNSERLGCSKEGTRVVSNFFQDREQHDATQALTSRLVPFPHGEIVDTEEARKEKRNTNMTCLSSVVDMHFEGDSRLHSRAFVVLKNGHLVYEKYKQGWNYTTRLHGWSMTKSLLNTLIGVRVLQNKLSLSTTLEELLTVDNKLHPDNLNVTIFDLLTMTDGTNIDETYTPGAATIRMLFESNSLETFSKEIGQRRNGRGCFRYSSFSTNLLSMALAGSFDTREEYLKFPTVALFSVLGMNSALIETDSHGIYIASSFSWMTARDWSRLGLLYAQDGMWRQTRVLPAGWMEMSRTPTKTSRMMYGAHFWLGGLVEKKREEKEEREESEEKEKEMEEVRLAEECDAVYPKRVKNRDLLRHGFPSGSMLMKGFEEQIVAIHPESNSVIVRLGATKIITKWDDVSFYSAVYQCLAQKHR